jgi:hypothetical protein
MALTFDSIAFGTASDYAFFSEDALIDSGRLQGTWRYYDQTLTEYQVEPNGFDADDTSVSEAIISGTCKTIVAFEDPADSFDASLLLIEATAQCEEWRNCRTVPLPQNDWFEDLLCSYWAGSTSAADRPVWASARANRGCVIPTPRCRAETSAQRIQ